jgi:hypothetical protein
VFDPLLGANGIVLTCALTSGGKILIGGEFDRVNDVRHARVALLHGGAPAPFELTLLAHPDGGIQLMLPTAAGRNYSLQTSTNLVHWRVWTNFVATGSSWTILDGGTSTPRMFYRAVLQP